MNGGKWTGQSTTYRYGMQQERTFQRRSQPNNTSERISINQQPRQNNSNPKSEPFVDESCQKITPEPLNSLNMQSRQMATNTSQICIMQQEMECQSFSECQKKKQKEPPIDENRKKLQKQPRDPSIFYNHQREVNGIQYSFNDYEYGYDAQGYDRVMRNITDGIVWIKLLKKPLSNWQLTDMIFHHKYLVIKADRYYSFEKDMQTIIVQVSDHEELVTHFLKGEKRVKGKIVQWNPQLVKWQILNSNYPFNQWYLRAYSQDERRLEYHWLKCNCKVYACKFYNLIAQDKFWHII